LDHCHEQLDIPGFYDTFKLYAMEMSGHVDDDDVPREMGKLFFYVIQELKSQV